MFGGAMDLEVTHRLPNVGIAPRGGKSAAHSSI